MMHTSCINMHWLKPNSITEALEYGASRSLAEADPISEMYEFMLSGDFVM